ncbi:putative bifunctional diguanylate cyclase/phosphodiesterase, partial [Piscinibacter sp.]|uniref:putative bifunctional diguanylate cyclase/phosphodiesterase n=1 Tax=Piscinibacter sp. TaxID=1903157 RepID=UPI002F423952
MNDPSLNARVEGGWWGGFRRAHLHDYNPAATRFWLALALTGALALALAGTRIAQLPASEWWQILGWTGLVAIAAAFPIPIPRTKHSIATGDVVIFLLLALHGAPAAALAAGLEGLIAALRSSARVSSRIATLSAATAGMTLGGALFELSQPWLQQQGLPHAAAHLAALALAAMVYYMASTMVLMQVICLKRGMRLTLREWFAGTSWVGTLYLVSAVLAGMLSLNAQLFGRSAAAVGVLVIGVSLALLRAHFRQQIAEHEAQEARVAAAELEAEQNQKRFHSAFTHASIGMAIVSSDGMVLQANQALCALLGYDESQIVRRALRSLLNPSDASLLDRHVAGVVARRADTFSIELRCLGADRRETWVSLHCALFDDHATADAGLIFQLHDITSRRRAEGELHHIAYHDSLTDLANRNCFQERLNVAVERSRCDRRFSFAVMYLDLDRFKIVNDSLGHPAGDELLKEVARRLNACVRPTDLVARLGGDEFAILLEETHQHADAMHLAQRLLQALEAPVRINGTEVRPLASIGITFSDLGYREPDEILRDADLAMYKAKADGKGRLALFDNSLHEQLGHKLQLEADLRHAIGEGQLSLAYQPLFDLEPYRLNGFEALARWVHPTRGVISPGVFIALAEETGCIEALTTWAIDEAARQLAAWRRQSPRCDELVMHVNVSGKDLSRPHLVPHVRDVLQRHGLPARLLTLEITESMLMEHRELALRSLGELSALGVKLGIDDFGTGYSSLAYLTTLPISELKIDRSFIRDLGMTPQSSAVVTAIIALARSLGLRVIAEGVENLRQMEVLHRLGCGIMQGFLFSKAQPPEDIESWLKQTVLPRKAPWIVGANDIDPLD